MKINEDSVRRAVDGHWADASLTEAQKQAILAQCRPQLTLASRRPVMKRALALAAALCFAMAACLGVAAAPDLRAHIVGLSEYAAAQLQPISVSAQDQGLRMEVLAAVNDGQQAVIYLTLQDTLGQGRLKGGVRLQDHELKAAGEEPDYAFDTMVAYDEAAETATLRLESLGDAGTRWDGRKVSLNVAGLLSGYQVTEPAPVGVTVAQIQQAFPQPALERSTCTDTWVTNGEAGGISHAIDSGEMRFLKESMDWTPAEAPWLTVQAAGVVDGDLHVLIGQDDKMGRFDQLYLTLQDGEGQPVRSEQAVMGLGQRKQAGRYVMSGEYHDQWEYVFDLPADADPADTQLMYSLETYREHLEGEWNVTFRLEGEGESRTAQCSIPFGGWTARSVKASLLGITVEGPGQMLADDPPVRLEVWLTDGSKAEFYSASSSWSGSENGGLVQLKSSFALPQDPDTIARITLNGVEVVLGEVR